MESKFLLKPFLSPRLIAEAILRYFCSNRCKCMSIEQCPLVRSELIWRLLITNVVFQQSPLRRHLLSNDQFEPVVWHCPRWCCYGIRISAGKRGQELYCSVPFQLNALISHQDLGFLATCGLHFRSEWQCFLSTELAGTIAKFGTAQHILDIAPALKIHYSNSMRNDVV